MVLHGINSCCSKYILQTAGFDGRSLLLVPCVIFQRHTCFHSSFPEHQPDPALVRRPPRRQPPSPNPCARSFQNYTDYFKCIAAKGEDFAPCKQFKRAYNSLCPSAYTGLLFPYACG